MLLVGNSDNSLADVLQRAADSGQLYSSHRISLDVSKRIIRFR